MSEETPQKRKPKVKSEGLWLMSFADLSFVLMCFFALLLSFSSMDKQRFENVRDGMLAKSPNEIKKKKPVKKKMNNLKELSEKVLDEIKKQKLDATVTYTRDGVKVELNEKVFFRSGSALINPAYKHMSDRVMKVIAKSPDKYKLVFEGHTDDIPLGRRAIYRDNWQLSSARALSLLKDMQRRGVKEDRMSIVAFAHTKPKVKYQTLRGKKLSDARRKNRRVVIWIQ